MSLRPLAARALLALCLATEALAQDRVQLNTITRIEVKGATVEITGSRRASFTTFSMADPPRLVIDISEGVFQGVPRELPGAGQVTGIRTAAYGSESAAIARVVIGFQQELETDIVASGQVLIVKLPPEKAATPGQAEALPPPDAQAQERARLEREAAAREAEVARRAAEAERQEQARLAQLEKEEAARKARAAEDARKAAEAERLAALAAERQEQARLAQQARDEATRKAKEAEAERLARVEAERQERARLAQVAREAAALKARQEAEAAREAAAARKAAEAERVARLEAERREKLQRAQAEKEEAARRKREAEAAKLAAAEAQRQEAARRVEAQRQDEARRKREAEEARLLAARSEAARRSEDADARVARAAEQKARQARELDEAAARTPSPEALAKGASAQMTYVGFKQTDGVGKVSLRTSTPVRYSVGESPRQVVVTLENTEINLPGNQRILDTSFFDTAVSLVRPEALGDHRVRVTITLKREVAYRTAQAGNELTLEFARPR
jgi:hypothetical protein